MDFDAVVSKAKKRVSLFPDEMEEAMHAIVGGGVSTPQIEALLLALREKGETAEEITAAAQVMREYALKLSKAYPDLLDTCGTGGDAKNTLNISTLASLVACSAGAKVAKHGNRSVSGVCGSADLLEMLGVKIELSPEGVEKCIKETGFGFFFAPQFHPAIKAAMPARKNIQGKTLFNLLGPLANPAGADYQLIGVYSQPLVQTFAQVLAMLETKRAMVVHGLEGLDEISLSGPTQVAEVINGSIRMYRFEPEDAGLESAPLATFQCRTKEDNKTRGLKILNGELGPESDIVCLNAGAALYVAGIALSIGDGLFIAHEAIKNGKSMKKLEQIIKVTQSLH